MTVKDPDVEILFGGGRIVLNNTGEECEACVYLDCLADKSIVIKCEAGHDDQTHCLSDEQTNALRDWLNSKSEKR